MNRSQGRGLRRRVGSSSRRLLATGVAALSLMLSQAGSAPGAVAAAHAAPPATASVNASAATGAAPAKTVQITAHDGQFWQGTSPIVLRGFNTWVGNSTQGVMDTLAGWGVNFIRLHVVWAWLEAAAPVKQGNNWVHTYDGVYAAQVAAAITYAHNDGIAVMVEGTICTGANDACPFFGFPDWLYTAPYNSYGITYPQTPEGATEAVTNFWTDALQQQFMTDLWKYVVTLVKPQSGIMGYELLNEPIIGTYPNTPDTTKMSLAFQLAMAQAVRAIDPARVIVFMSHGAYGAGIPGADLSGIVTLGNAAFDVHDYIGARWGNALLNDPSNVSYLEKIQILLEPSTNDPTVPFVGTVANEDRWLTTLLPNLQANGLPLLVGEFGAHADDLAIDTYYGVVTTALNSLNLSWCAWYTGDLGITDGSGNLLPWGPIVISAL